MLILSIVDPGPFVKLEFCLRVQRLYNDRMTEDLFVLSSDTPTAAAPLRERRDAAENRARVLAAAEKLFRAQGVPNVHMAEIAQAAGVGKGTLYRRFANKGELCLALMDEQLQTYQNQVLAGLRTLRESGASGLDRLKYFLRSEAAFVERHVPLLCEVQRGGLLDALQQIDAPVFGWQQMTALGLLREAAQANEIDPEMDLPLTVDLLLAPLQANFFRFLCQGRGYSSERIGQALAASVQRLAR